MPTSIDARRSNRSSFFNPLRRASNDQFDDANEDEFYCEELVEVDDTNAPRPQQNPSPEISSPASNKLPVLSPESENENHSIKITQSSPTETPAAKEETSYDMDAQRERNYQIMLRGLKERMAVEKDAGYESSSSCESASTCEGASDGRMKYAYDFATIKNQFHLLNKDSSWCSWAKLSEESAIKRDIFKPEKETKEGTTSSIFTPDIDRPTKRAKASDSDSSQAEESTGRIATPTAMPNHINATDSPQAEEDDNDTVRVENPQSVDMEAEKEGSEGIVENQSHATSDEETRDELPPNTTNSTQGPSATTRRTTEKEKVNTSRDSSGPADEDLEVVKEDKCNDDSNRTVCQQDQDKVAEKRSSLAPNKNSLPEPTEMTMQSNNSFQDEESLSWEARFLQLQSFKAEFGHANPCGGRATVERCRSLGTWLRTQRSHYRKGGGLSDKQAQMLCEVGCKGFDDDNASKARENDVTSDAADVLKRSEGRSPAKSNGFKPNILIWEARFEQLEAHKKQHGHANPTTSEDGGALNARLGRWLSNQRRRFRNGQLNAAKCEKLIQLGCTGFGECYPDPSRQGDDPKGKVADNFEETSRAQDCKSRRSGRKLTRKRRFGIESYEFYK